MYICLEKQQFRLLVRFSLIFAADTKIMFGYNFVAPLKVNHIGKLINPYLFYQQKAIVKCNNTLIHTINVIIPQSTFYL